VDFITDDVCMTTTAALMAAVVFNIRLKMIIIKSAKAYLS
jgi:hypothetical protein